MMNITRVLFLLFSIAISLFFYSCNQKRNNQYPTCDEIQENYSSFLSEASTNWETIAKKIESALQRDSSCAGTYILLGDLYFINKKYKTASLYFRQALTYDASNIYSLFKLGLSFKEQGIYDSAVIFFNTAEKLKNIDGFVIDYNEELDEISGSIKSDVRYSSIVFNRAVANYQFGDYLTSVYDLNYCINKSMYLKQAYFYRALIYARIKDSVKACSDSWQAKILGNDSVDRYLLEYSIKCPESTLFHNLLLKG